MGATAVDKRAEMQADADLLLRLRRGEERAVAAFWERFEPVVLDAAGRIGVPAGEREDLVLELLGDICEALTQSAVVPRSLAAYVLASFCNRVLKRVRAEDRRLVHETRACEDVGNGERAVTECCSEYSMRAAGGSVGEYHPPSEMTRALWNAIKARLKPDDITLLVHAANHVSLREAGEAIGITHGNARVRMTRIRGLAIEVARRFGETRGPAERAAIVRWLQRMGCAPSEED